MTLPFAWSSILSYRPLSHDCYRLLEEMGDSFDDNAGCRPNHLCVLVHGYVTFADVMHEIELNAIV